MCKIVEILYIVSYILYIILYYILYHHGKTKWTLKDVIYLFMLSRTLETFRKQSILSEIWKWRL